MTDDVAPLNELDTLFDLASDPNNLYIGYAPQGTPTSLPVWTIRRIAMTSGSPSSAKWTGWRVAVWDNRATETYL